MQLIRYRSADIQRGRFDLPHRVNIAETLGDHEDRHRRDYPLIDKDSLST
jgi:hypothetical protein